MNRLAAWIFAVMITMRAPELLACAVCSDRAPGTSTTALNYAIYVLLGILAGVFCGFGFFIFNLIRRAKQGVPEHILLAESIQQ